MRNPLLLLLLPTLAGCHDPALVRLQVVNDSQEKEVAIAVRCDGQLVLDTVVARYKTADDRLSRYLRLTPGPHRLAVVARGQRTHLDTLLSTVGTNVLGVTFRYDSLPARTRKTYFADGAEGEITFPAFYVRRSFRVYQFQTSQPLHP